MLKDLYNRKYNLKGKKIFQFYNIIHSVEKIHIALNKFVLIKRFIDEKI